MFFHALIFRSLSKKLLYVARVNQSNEMIVDDLCTQRLTQAYILKEIGVYDLWSIENT